MKTESRKRGALKIGAVFTAGLLLLVVQFGAGGLWPTLYFFSMPFTMWKLFVRDGFLLVWYGLAVVMLISVGACIWSRKFLWIAYVLTAAYWLWTYAFMTFSF